MDSPLHLVKTLVVFPLELLSDRIPQDQLTMFAAIGCDFFMSRKNQAVFKKSILCRRISLNTVDFFEEHLKTWAGVEISRKK